MVVNQVLLLLLKPQPYVPAKTFATNCSVRVCWYCHQSGGTDVVDLPDILLPAGQYLDMFDSESETDLPGTSSDEELVEV